jgi:UDP-glucose 4-epimerase
MKLLATGSSGGIGKHILIESEIDFRNFHTRKSLSGLEVQSSGSTLIHLAAMTSIEQVQEDPDESFKVNVSSTIDLFRAFATNRGKRFVFASTGHVYGKTPEDHLSKESDPLNPLSLYAEQKILAERGLIQEAKNSGVELVVLRIFSVFGLGMKSHFLAGRIERAVKNLEAIPKIYNSDDVRDFSLPQDIASLVKKSTAIPLCESLIINLCSGRSLTVRDIVRTNFPQIKDDSFVGGNSQTPRLVGDPELKNYLLNS